MESRDEIVAIDRRRLRQSRRRERFESSLQDLRYAARGLARRPALLLVTTITLTIGIAATTVMFSVVDQLLLQPPPGVSEPESVKRIYYQGTRKGRTSTQSVTPYPMISKLRESVPAFGDVAGSFRSSVTLGRGVGARNIDVQLVSGNYFRLLGVRPQLGRTFVDAEDRVPITDRVAVVSDAFWRSELAGATDVLGRRLLVAGKDFVVVGVAPKGFTGIDRLNIDVWVPMGAMATDMHGEGWHNTANVTWVQAIARLRVDGTSDAAETQGTAAYRAMLREWNQPWRDSTGRVLLGTLVATQSPRGISEEGKVSLWLLGVSGIVLLIACSNVANVLLARTLQRRREIAVRLALGVSRSRLVCMLLTESALLAGTGAAAAVAVTFGVGRLVQQTLLPGMVWNSTVVDARVWGFTLGAMMLCVLLAGVAPAMYGMRTSVSATLKASEGSSSKSRPALRTALLVLQAALSVVLLVGAGLFVRSLRNVNTRDVGIDLSEVVRVTMNLRGAGFEASQIEDIYRRGRERLRALPSVEEVSVLRGSVPLASENAMGFRIPGVDSLPGLPGGGPYGAIIESNFLSTVGARVLRGRNFSMAEDRVPTRTMLINEMLAKAYFGADDPVGKCVMVRADSVCTEIIGVVENVMLVSLVNDDRAMVYLAARHPLVGQATPQAMLVRAPNNADAVARQARKDLQQLSPGMPYVEVASFADLVAPQLRPWRLGATMFTLLGGIALGIAVVGLYGVMALLVSQRTHEIGVRMALGANAMDVVRLVSWQSIRAVLTGLAVGLGSAVIASRWIADLLYETSPRDPAVYASAALVLILAAVVASVVPARRATGTDPARALRAE
ncbi:MAG: ADOP family duplicated permease [Gemmatimonadota bacterium]